ncbi:hypothetical protein MMC17_007306 [Xylographa soralifera]|nr:hypothetical protein [Xylographa soralifera]
MELRKRSCPKEFYHSSQPAPKAPKLQKRDHQDGRATRKSTRIEASQQTQTQKKQPENRHSGGLKSRLQVPVLQEPEPRLKTLRARKRRRILPALQKIEGHQKRSAIKAAAPEEAVDSAQRTPHSSPRPKTKRRKPLAPAQRIVDGVDQSRQDTSAVYSCPQCSFPCWICNSATILQEPVPPIEEEIEEAIEENSIMDSRSESTKTTESSKSKRKRVDGRKYLGPKDEYFESYILEPSNVQIQEGRIISKPEDILPLEQPGESPPSEVYLNITDATALTISDQLIISHQRKYDENALTKIVNKYLAPFESYVNKNQVQSVKSLCRDEYKPRKEGPSMPFTRYTYDWDIKPDSTYMLALNLFDDDLRKVLHRPELDWILAEPHGVCPYLTLEYKCAEKAGKDSDAVCQIAVASVVWLVQRKKLREALGLSDIADLKHYSIILNSTHFQVWKTTCSGSSFSVQWVGKGSLDDSEGVHQYVEWWNAIHKWGLGSNAQSFKQDVEALCENKQNDESHTAITPPISDEQASYVANQYPATDITPPLSVNTGSQGAMPPPTSTSLQIRPIPAPRKSPSAKGKQAAKKGVK